MVDDVGRPWADLRAILEDKQDDVGDIIDNSWDWALQLLGESLLQAYHLLFESKLLNIASETEIPDSHESEFGSILDKALTSRQRLLLVDFEAACEKLAINLR